MRAIDPVDYTLTDVDIPTPKDDEVLIKVRAAGINRADLLQREGRYPPPPGASTIPGLEVAGTVVAAAAVPMAQAPNNEELTDAHGNGEPLALPRVGDEVIALLAGGGYAEYVCAPYRQCLPLPASLSPIEGAALPEALATAWLNLIDIAGLSPGETVLIHGGSGGVGTTAIQLASGRGARVLATAGSQDKA